MALFDLELQLLDSIYCLIYSVFAKNRHFKATFKRRIPVRAIAMEINRSESALAVGIKRRPKKPVLCLTKSR
jgi:hypothetical protein